MRKKGTPPRTQSSNPLSPKISKIHRERKRWALPFWICIWNSILIPLK